MATRISTASRNAAADAVTALLDAGSGPGYIELRTGTQPATGETAATGSVLATIEVGDPAFNAAVTGVSTANAIAVASGSAPGTAEWFRAYDSAGNGVIDGAVTATGGGGEMQLNSTTISSGVDVAVTSWTITMPGA